MDSIKEFLKRKNVSITLHAYLIDALGAMAFGLFASLLIGTIFETLGNQTGVPVFLTIAGYAKSATGPALGIAIAHALKAPQLVLFSAATVGLAGNDLGGPVGALVSTIIAAELGKIVSKETRLDILVTPGTTIISGVLAAQFEGVVLNPAPVPAASGGVKQKVSLDDLFSQIKQGEMKDLNVIVKADVQGSAEAVKSSLEKLSNEEVRVRVIHCAVGAISESDVMLATTSNAIIVGFNVRPDNNAKDTAARNKVDMRMYRVIYDCINEIEAAMKGMLAPKFKEVELGQAEVRNVFRITGVGMVAGCYVTDGKMQRGAQMRLLRDNVVIYDGSIASLQRFKDSVKEVAAGYECGITFEKFQDIKEGDVIEAYLMEQIEV